MPVNAENGPSDDTRAMLIRQSKVSRDASDGSTAISVVEPPPFFQSVISQVLARIILKAVCS